MTMRFVFSILKMPEKIEELYISTCGNVKNFIRDQKAYKSLRYVSKEKVIVLKEK